MKKATRSRNIELLNITHSSSVALYLRYALLLPSTQFLPLIDCAPVQWKFTHFHGQKTSRQNRYKSIYEDTSCHKRTIVFRLLSLVLFFTPDVHLRELKRVWTDELVIEEIWRSFMQKLVTEWVEFVLYVSCAFCTFEIKEWHHFDTTQLTVDRHAHCKCRIYCHSRRCLIREFKRNDQCVSCSDCKYHVIGV